MLIYSYQLTDLASVPAEPVTVAYAKDHLRVDHSADDTYIGNLITAARQYAEVYLARSIVQHQYRADLSDFADNMKLPLGPVQRIDSVKYYDTDSPTTLQTLSTAVYSLHHDCVVRNYGQSWESVDVRPDAVQITYTAGYSDLASPEDTVANVPEAINSAILLLVGDLYEDRESQVLYPGQLLENRAFRMLLDTYRKYR